MKLADIVKKLNLEVFCCSQSLDNEVTGGYCSDLLSDVMGNAQEGNVWITLQVHKNIIAVASLKDIVAIILVKGIKPQQEVIEASVQENIPLMGSELSAFELAGKVYALLNQE